MTFKPDMTLEQIKDEELNALDKLAAEKIMGWVPKDRRWYQGEAPGLSILKDSPFLRPEHIWQPTRNIAQAFEVAEKFPYYMITKWETEPDLFLALVGDSGAKAQSHKDETAPLTLTIACLKAVGAL